MQLASKFNKALLTNKFLYQIYIQSQTTPNPNYLKFIPEGRKVLGADGTLDISDSKFADCSPLAK